MSIYIHNLQKHIAVNVPLLKRNSLRIKKAMRLQKFDVNIWIYPDAVVQKMNKYDRGVDSPTDILSYSELDLKPKDKIVFSKKTPVLGNLVLGINYINRYCLRNKRHIDDYLVRLIVHGMCHLTGYDHETEQDRKMMRNREYYILKKCRELKESEVEPLEDELKVPIVKKKKKKKIRFKVHYIDPDFQDEFKRA